jgi:hypothetical protein
MPRFHGVATLPADADGGGGGGQPPPRSYLVLEDVTRPFLRPCVMDVKMGVQAWDEDAPPAKVAQERGKYPPQQAVGLRVTGMRVWRRDERRYTEHGRAFGYALDDATLPHAFYEFLHDGTRVRTELIPPLLERLAAVRGWFAAQSDFRFYGSSLLFVYDGGGSEPAAAAAAAAVAAAAPPPRVDVRMIDFAHVWPIRPAEQPAGRDDGYLKGLDSVIRYLRHVQAVHGGGCGPVPREGAARGSGSPAGVGAGAAASQANGEGVGAGAVAGLGAGSTAD